MRRRLDGADEMPDFDDLVGGGGLDAGDEARLRRVHDLLVQAGPPPELSPALERRVPAETGRLVRLPRAAQRRGRAYGFAAAAAAAAAVLAGGFLLGRSTAKPAGFEATRVVPMHGIAGSRGSIRIGQADAGGNWPMLVSVTGLPSQSKPGAYYELWLARSGRPVAPCGTFRVHGAETAVRLTVPYRLGRFDGWIVTAVAPGGADPGAVVMTT